MPDRLKGPGIMLIDRRLLDQPPEGPRASAGLAAIVCHAASTATEAGCHRGTRSGRERRGGSVR